LRIGPSGSEIRGQCQILKVRANAEQIAEMGFYFHEVKDCILLAVAESGPEVVEVKHLQL
jgi:hypothetical protein